MVSDHFFEDVRDTLAGERRGENHVAMAEGKMSFHAHLKWTSILLELPQIAAARGGVAIVDAMVFFQLARVSGSNAFGQIRG